MILRKKNCRQKIVKDSLKYTVYLVFSISIPFPGLFQTYEFHLQCCKIPFQTNLNRIQCYTELIIILLKFNFSLVQFYFIQTKFNFRQIIFNFLQMKLIFRLQKFNFMLMNFKFILNNII